MVTSCSQNRWNIIKHPEKSLMIVVLSIFRKKSNNLENICFGDDNSDQDCLEVDKDHIDTVHGFIFTNQRRYTRHVLPIRLAVVSARIIPLATMVYTNSTIKEWLPVKTTEAKITELQACLLQRSQTSLPCKPL